LRPIDDPKLGGYSARSFFVFLLASGGVFEKRRSNIAKGPHSIVHKAQAFSSEY
jgi:hypothetical protein